ncbi:dihydroxy-acid dehydratase [Pseudonocardia ailaonensis]|uniref:Dihydroxy-acid dehydratase n=1 Tax=Pseudonocardia ailaonensis TaxID=367279 RepID=A0ABN2N507_9PSEU
MSSRTAGSVASVIEVGATAAERVVGPVTRTDIVRYAGASGDFNPIHHDEEYARAAGYPGVFSVGMFQAGVLAGFAVDWLGAERLRGLQVRFKEQVWPGDVLTCRGRIASVEATETGRLVEVELTCLRQTGAAAIVGRATFELAEGDGGATS